ncbi:hypothetical protein GCM10010353_60850 [Streptomyces chryseus]|uniref:Uncharacterized protein n=1 Tax=Streptomyces chryseus TaxID=68186 RepID=A0ABQ3EC30_9ACTN|nr:hypothetical protein GCM10010353_60850 [Streptomyces chryseus]GHB25987.1 hypothetical protein GCM10010346_56990 [Streptomyces chryseus]
MHRDEILRRDGVGDLRPASPAGQMLEAAPRESSHAQRQTDAEVAPRIPHGLRIGDGSTQPFFERP